MNMKRTMKLLGIVIASIALVACSGGGSDPVKTVKVVKVVKVVKTDSNGVVDDSSTRSYDNNGLLYKEVFDIERGFEQYKEYTYKDGVILKIERFGRHPPADFISREVITMDEHGTVLSQTTSSGISNTYINTYNTDGRLLKRAHDNGVSVRTIDYIYNGNTVEVMTTSLSTGRKLLDKYSYNDKGNLLFRAGHDVNTGDVTYRNGYKHHDDNGDGNVDRQTFDSGVNGSIDWTKTYTWAEFDVLEKYANRVLKGCTVKQGGCEGERSDRAGLPVMSYGK